MKAVRIVLRYLVLTLLVAFAVCALQFLAGLAPQQSVRAHLMESMPQLIDEGLAPGVLYDGHPRSKIDNLSENYILTYSYYMDTRRDPDAVLTNPGRQIQDPYDELFLQTEELLERELPPDTNYTRYWMGFRMYVRPMLAIMNYMDARQCIQWGFFLLLGAVTIALYRRTKSALTALAFPVAISQLNPIVVASCFQYSACFYIAFIGMLLVPVIRGKRFTQAGLFYLLGMLTQIFDFFTAPLLTCGLPLLMLLLLPETDAKDNRARWKLLATCVGTWLIGYVGAWLVKLVLTTLLTPQDALFEGLDRLLFWMRPNAQTYETGLIAKAAFWCTINIVDLVPLLLEIALLLLWLIAVLRKRPDKRAWLTALPFLAAALLPYLWFAVAARPAYEHFYFQYRSLGVFLYGGFVFLLRTAGWDKLLPERA